MTPRFRHTRRQIKKLVKKRQKAYAYGRKKNADRAAVYARLCAQSGLCAVPPGAA